MATRMRRALMRTDGEQLLRIAARTARAAQFLRNLQIEIQHAVAAMDVTFAATFGGGSSGVENFGWIAHGRRLIHGWGRVGSPGI
jgi:hypothetical protein